MRAARAGSRAAEVTEDSLAYLRDAWDFKNCLLAEQDNGTGQRPFSRPILFQRLAVLPVWGITAVLRIASWQPLAKKKRSRRPRIISAGAGEWMIRLGDGTEESHARMVGALDELWKFTGELFMPSRYEQQLIGEGILPDLSLLRNKWDEKVKEIFAAGQSLHP